MISKQPSIARAWKMTFWTTYDNLGLLIALNLIWLLSSLTILLIPAATAGLFVIARLLITEKTAGIKDFFYATFKYLIISTLTVLIFVVFFFFFAFNIRFYLDNPRLLGIVLAGINFWLLFICCLMSLYIYPLLTIDKKLLVILRYSFILTTKHIGLLCLLAIILPIIGIALLAIFCQNCFLELQHLYQPEQQINKPARSLKELWRPWE